MNRLTAVLAAVIAVASLVTSAANAQDRSQGVSMHMLPKRVADIGRSLGLHGGQFSAIET